MRTDAEQPCGSVGTVGTRKWMIGLPLSNFWEILKWLFDCASKRGWFHFRSCVGAPRSWCPCSIWRKARVSDPSDGWINPEAFLYLDFWVDLVLTELVVVGQVKDYQSSMISIAVSFGAEMVTRFKLDWFTMVGSDTCILKCRNECGQGCYAMICWYMLIWCRAWSMFAILNWNHGLLVWAWCFVRPAYTNICTLDFAWLNLQLLTGSSAIWRRLPFAQRQRTFYPFGCSVSI